MKRKITALFIAVSVMAAYSPVFAENENKPEGEYISVMNINEAEEYALSHSLKISIKEHEAEEKNQSRIKAEKTFDELKKKGYEYYTFEDGLLTVKGYYVDYAKAQSNNAKRTLETTKTEVINEVRTDIYSYISAKEKEEIAEKNLENAKEKLSFAKTEFESGMISRLDYELFTLSEENAAISLDKAKRDVLMALENIKAAIGFPNDETLYITGDVPKMDLSYAGPDEAIRLSRTQNAYLSLMENLNIAESRYKFAEAYFYPKKYDFYIEQQSFEKTKATVMDSISGIDLGIKTLYNELTTLKNQVEYTEKYLEYLKKDTDASYSKYRLGLITATAYVDAEQSYYKAQNDYKDLLLSYRKAIIQYKAMYSAENQ